MAIKVLVPRLGEGVEEVTVTKWLKAVGDSVNELEPLLEVNTDKVDTEIPAPVSGVVLQIAAAEGVAAKVGELLAVIGQPGEQTEWTTDKPEKRALGIRVTRLPVGGQVRAIRGSFPGETHHELNPQSPKDIE